MGLACWEYVAPCFPAAYKIASFSEESKKSFFLWELKS